MVAYLSTTILYLDGRISLYLYIFSQAGSISLYLYFISGSERLTLSGQFVVYYPSGTIQLFAPFTEIEVTYLALQSATLSDSDSLLTVKESQTLTNRGPALRHRPTLRAIYRDRSHILGSTECHSFRF